MVAWGAIGSAIATGAKKFVPAISKLGSAFNGNSTAFSNIAGGVGSLLGSFGFGKSGGTSLEDSMRLASYQNKLNKDYTQWLNENQYSFMRTGLENAGYNPLLAVGASPSTSNQSMPIATSPNTATVDPSKILLALSTLADIRNKNADTDMKNAGIISRFLGSKLGSRAEKAVSSFIGDVTKSSKEIREVSDDVGTILKGYVSNTSNAPNDLPNSMYTYQPDLDEKGSLDNTELHEIKMKKRIERRRKRYGL